MLFSGFVGSIFSPRSVAFVALTASFLNTAVYGAGHEGSCTPTLEIEIGLPAAATVTEKFGETDHYLAANVGKYPKPLQREHDMFTDDFFGILFC